MMSCRSEYSCEGFLNADGDAVVLLADHGGVERVGTRGERIDRREQTQAGDAARENRCRVEVREGRRRRGVGQVISRRTYDRLDRRGIDPVLVEVMRSCRSPISVASVGW